MKNLSKLSLLVVALFGVICTDLLVSSLRAEGFSTAHVPDVNDPFAGASRPRRTVDPAKQQAAAVRHAEMEKRMGDTGNAFRDPFAGQGRSDGFTDNQASAQEQSAMPDNKSAKTSDNRTDSAEQQPNIGDGPQADNHQVAEQQRDTIDLTDKQIQELYENDQVVTRSNSETDEEKLSRQIDENIMKRIKGREYLSKWGAKEHIEFRNQVRDYGKKFADKVKDLNLKQRLEFENILTEGLMKNQSLMSRISQAHASVGKATADFFVGVADVFRYIKTGEANVHTEEHKALKNKHNNTFKDGYLVNEQGQRVTDADGKYVTDKGFWDRHTVDEGRFDFRTADMRYKDVIDILRREPFVDINSRLKLTPSQQEQFVNYAKEVLTPEGFSMNRIERAFQKGGDRVMKMMPMVIFLMIDIAIITTIVKLSTPTRYY